MQTKEKSLDEFYKLTDAEDYFDFFDIDYDKALVNVKRFHILKGYGAMIRTGLTNLKGEDEKLLDFLKFSLLKVYGDFKNGYAPWCNKGASGFGGKDQLIADYLRYL